MHSVTCFPADRSFLESRISRADVPGISWFSLIIREKIEQKKP